MGQRMSQSGFRFQPFSNQQLKVLTWWLPESGVSDMDGIIADGAIRSGKTVSMALSFVLWAMESFNGQNFAMCGKTIGSFRRNVLAVLKQMLRSRGFRYVDHRGDNLLEVRRKGTVNFFYIFGGRDERSQDLIQGITLAGVLLDEVALMPESFVNQATGRCSVAGSKFWFNCNPENPGHWFKKGWIDERKNKRLLYLHFTMDDNLSLTKDVKARYGSMYSGVFFKRFVKGLWVAAAGAIYPQFADDRTPFLLDAAPAIQYAVIGVDFGGTGSAHSFSLTGFTQGMREVVLLDECYHSNKGTKAEVWSPEQLNKAFVAFVRKAQLSGYRVYQAFCDSAEQTLIQGLRVAVARARLGIEICNARKGPINDRIAFYNSLMAQGRFKVMSHCVHAIDALESAVYNGKDPVNDERLDDGTTNIDSLDSMEYSTESVQDDILYLGLRG